MNKKLNFSTVHACKCLTVAHWQCDCAYSVYSRADPVVTRKLYSPQCQTAPTPLALHIHPLVPLAHSALSALAGSLSGSTNGRAHTNTNTHTQTHTHTEPLLMQISFFVHVRIKMTSQTRMTGYHSLQQEKRVHTSEAAECVHIQLTRLANSSKNNFLTDIQYSYQEIKA